ncbi:uncharacterized protein VTP21DRAFT_4533 [Calcarisporiella thermophila]|uniref:uncharacterized protein n=1 Tax=Calcarisporiella thermophila TaxID=911321 RepID=UPI0037445216
MAMLANSDLQLAPYVNRGMRDVSEEEWCIAAASWNHQLSRLLKLPESEFRQNIETNPTVLHFIESFLHTHPRIPSFHISPSYKAVTLETNLLKRVLMFIMRISSVSLREEERWIVDPPVLLDLAALYGRNNRSSVGQIYKNVQSWRVDLMEEFKPIVDSIVELLTDIEQTYAESDGEGDNTLASGQHSAMFNCLLDISVTIAGLCCVSYEIASLFCRHGEFWRVLMRIYNVALPRMWPLVSQNMDKGGKVDVEGAEWFLVETAKEALLAIAGFSLDALFFLHFGFRSSEDGRALEPFESFETSEAENALEQLNDLFFWMLEQSQIDRPAPTHADTQLLVDLEIEWRMSNKLRRIRSEAFAGDEARLDYIIMSFEQIRDMNMSMDGDTRRARLERIVNAASGKHKRKSKPLNGTTQADPGYVDRTLRISHIQDLFPDLGDGFIEECLVEFNDDTEAVIMRLLEGTLPERLNSLDRKMPRAISSPSALPPAYSDLDNLETDLARMQVEESPLSQRRNIHDNDEFDVFAGRQLDPERVHIGKKGGVNADRLLNDKSFVQEYKSDIIEAAYNTYEDEYDDTYDTSGMNMGAVEVRLVDEYEGEGKQQTQVDPGILNESELIRLFVTDPAVFERTASARRSTKREQMRRTMQMTDEQIEGWFIMFQRNPRKDKLIEKYEWKGEQREVPRENNPQEDKPANRRKPPADRPPVSPERQRANKERSKGKRANHNRRAMHDKKMMRSVQGGL